MNFDCSYVRGENRGGIGGVIQDHDGVVIRNFSRTVDAPDANKAKICSLLIGSRELHRLSAFNSIVEGDSKLAVQWGSSTTKYPWHFPDWMEKILYLSSILSFIAACCS